MNKYIKLEDAIEEAYQGVRRPNNDETWLRVYERLKNIPTVNIVHCRECISNACNTDGTTENWCYMFGYTVEGDDFCSYGERIEE